MEYNLTVRTRRNSSSTGGWTVSVSGDIPYAFEEQAETVQEALSKAFDTAGQLMSEEVSRVDNFTTKKEVE